MESLLAGYHGDVDFNKTANFILCYILLSVINFYIFLFNTLREVIIFRQGLHGRSFTLKRFLELKQFCARFTPNLKPLKNCLVNYGLNLFLS